MFTTMGSRMVSIILILSLLYINAVKCFKQKRVCNQSKLDNCMSNVVMLNNPALKYPETIEEIDNYCKKVPENTKCMTDYAKKCLDKFPRQAIRSVTQGMSNYFTHICDSKESAQKFKLDFRSNRSATSNSNGFLLKLHFLKCMNSVKTQLDNCSLHLVQSFTQISRITNGDNKIPLLCCNFWTYLNCMSDSIREEATVKYSLCNREHIIEMDSVFKSVMDGLTRYLCGTYTHRSDKCANLIALNSLNTTVTINLSKTILPPLIDIILSF